MLDTRRCGLVAGRGCGNRSHTAVRETQALAVGVYPQYRIVYVTLITQKRFECLLGTAS